MTRSSRVNQACSVVVLARQPVAGTVKTRLCPPLGPDQAAQLAAAMAADLLGGLAGLTGVDVTLALDREASRDAPAVEDLAAVAAALSIPVEDQGGGDLGRRMDDLMRRALARGGPALLVGGDIPDFPPELLLGACEALGANDAVLVPSLDGGYVAVGARRPVDALFRIDAPWGSERVLEATVAALAAARCAYEVLPAWEDVDDAAALGRLAGRLAAAPAPAPRTAALLERWKREGVRF